MLYDTDVLIWLFRGSAKAARVIEQDKDRRVSVVTYMELIQGARDVREAKTVKAFLADLGFQMEPLTENIGHRASIYMEEYGLRAGLRMADALIGATAVENRAILCTANQKHYRPVVEIDIKAFRP